MNNMFSEEEQISCPYCGEVITILVDPSVIPQEYVEDCQVCCQPIEIAVVESNLGRFKVSVRTDSE